MWELITQESIYIMQNTIGRLTIYLVIQAKSCGFTLIRNTTSFQKHQYVKMKV